ncbi:SWIM zinc finger family protein [Cellulomonas palmilytica]|uniref:SWIM zinc finger family protein n=1 Tax=Cellulomonas palmilytica TaxID=2608402 RepID=UPI001F3C618A|nr:SWIM zinc finger family protein [Cellulomonas palmilytica]UJP41670.1 SWIM zinc finger family protein [Cellulomonas palmilytica]
MTRAFTSRSRVDGDGVALGLAPALTPEGVVEDPSFFHGFAAHPQVLARGLLTLADVTATRYFQYTPSSLRDPVLTAHGDRLRAECFSSCNGVYARLDLLPDAFDSGELSHGTTNVDVGVETRVALSGVGRDRLLHLDVGRGGLTVSSPEATATERPVQMPGRWVRALGNVAELHRGLDPAFTVGAAPAKAFVASLPAATSTARTAWLVPDRVGVRLSNRRTTGGVLVAGLHRLSAAKRLLPHVTGLTVYGAAEPGPVVVELALPGARLVLGLTDEAWRGHSGEGSLLTALAGPTVAEDADLVSALLAFEPVVDVPRLARGADLDEERVHAALAVLAADGRVGWDLHDGAYFHRELPHDPERVEKDNPRLVSARRLVEAGAVRPVEGGWSVRSRTGGPDHRVSSGHLSSGHLSSGRCTCPWFLRHGTGRGPCAHLLAVRILEETA